DNFYNFNATGNPSLTCIQVDNLSYMTTNWSGGKDAGASFSTDCSCFPSITCPADITVCQDSPSGACLVKFFPDTPAVPSPVTIDYADRFITYTGVSINGGGNTATVAPGSSVRLA